MKFHLHFHLGPVRGFIGQARRSRDYWAGSFLLSWLVGQALKATGGNEKTIISPLVLDNKWTDATYGAIIAPGSKAPFLGTLTNHFTVEFTNLMAAKAAGAAAEAAIKEKWHGLACAVRTHILDDFDFAPQSNAIWDQQIGDATSAPFWEIYWIVAPEGEKDALALRKFTRQNGDSAKPHPLSGNLCTMLPGLADVSGIERRVDNDAFKDFWTALRAKINAKRYPGQTLSSAACLDLRDNESLSAPALVKRLFPLLIKVKPGAIEQAIGWVPNIRAEPPIAAALATAVESETQSALFWPSTSYVAATHWIARVQRSAPVLASQFADEIMKVGVQYAKAEASMWLRAIHEGGAQPLATVDGAMLHKTRLERAATTNAAALKKAGELLGKIRKSPIVAPNGAQTDNEIGAPASYYAIIRADGDRVGTILHDADRDTRTIISRFYNGFQASLRGCQGQTGEAAYGAIAWRNGVTLYAGADELMVFSPPEEAYGIAVALQDKFSDHKKDFLQKFSGKPPAKAAVGKLTLSASALYAHIRAPMRWAIDASAELLDKAAKDAAGRNALALGVFEIEGLRSPWAAPWNSAARRAFGDLLTVASGAHPPLWSNEFYHRLADRLRAFVVLDHGHSFPKAATWLRGNPGNARDQEVIEKLVLRACVERFDSDANTIAENISNAIKVELNASASLKAHSAIGHAMLAPLDILRVIGANWRKDA
ncbi:MAG: Cas10/Cmr2 second palm domain-containing protein [Pseudomonadota bacterium]